MRVLIVTFSLPSPAKPNIITPPLTRQIESLRSLGVDVDVMMVTGIPKFKYLQCWPRFAKLVDHADLIHAHYGYCGWLARSQLHKPLVVSFMGSDLLGTPNKYGSVTYGSRVVAFCDRWLAGKVDAVIVKSAEMARIIAPIKSHIIPNGVDTESFRPIERREARILLGLSAKKRYILFPGRPEVPTKAFPLFQTVVARASQCTPEALEPILLSGVPPDKVPIYMNACDVVLLTSWWEGSPNVVKEAMACDVPVVSVPVGDVSELLDGVDQCEVCPRDTEVLAEAVVRRLRGAGRSNGRDALRRQGLDLKTVATKIMRVYEDVLGTAPTFRRVVPQPGTVSGATHRSPAQQSGIL
jgi:glycosyltransferase involved in cell wall biosynthesis